MTDDKAADQRFHAMAKEILDDLCDDPAVWATHGMPGEGKLNRIENRLVEKFRWLASDKRAEFAEKDAAHEFFTFGDDDGYLDALRACAENLRERDAALVRAEVAENELTELNEGWREDRRNWARINAVLVERCVKAEKRLAERDASFNRLRWCP